MGDMTREEARRIIGEREALVDYMQEHHRDAYAAHPGLSTEEIAVEVMRGQAARIAELEAALAAEKEAHQACHAERVRYHDTAARLEAERLAAGATPPPGTVAALLARVEAEAVASAASAAKIEAGEGEDAADYQSGHAHGLRAAASLIRATLTPSPLDRAVAEVCALAPFLADVSGGPGTVADAWRDIAREMREPRGRDGLLTIAGLAMHGALACDAAKEPT